MIKRECGLGPCAFEDDMATRGLGLDGCDRSKNDFFCVSCCRTPGCNKNTAATNVRDNFFISAVLLLIMKILG